jgi:excisionase family DNA binding protein
VRGSQTPISKPLTRTENHTARGGAALNNLRAERPATQEPDWLTPKDLQHELRIGERLCYRLLRTGEIPSVRIGNLYRIRKEVLEELSDQAIAESCA